MGVAGNVGSDKKEESPRLRRGKTARPRLGRDTNYVGGNEGGEEGRIGEGRRLLPIRGAETLDCDSEFRTGRGRRDSEQYVGTLPEWGDRNVLHDPSYFYLP